MITFIIEKDDVSKTIQFSNDGTLLDLKKDAICNDNFMKLYKKLCPGPVTFILKKKKESKISKTKCPEEKHNTKYKTPLYLYVPPRIPCP